MRAKTVTKSSKHLNVGRWRAATVVMLLIFGGVVTGSSYILSSRGIDPIQFYTNMANPYMRFINVNPGMRKEEIADLYGKVLAWNDIDRKAFLATVPADERGTVDGYYLPGSYWFNVNASGSEVGQEMVSSFNTKVDKEVIKNKSNNLKKTINIDTAVRIASIIQREAAGPQDNRLVSGVIWNRLFKGMNLQMDATLQYVKGTSTDWWPMVESGDKKIDSPYNTYKYKGLPPTAISNPSIASINAAFNPIATDCLFYIHDTHGKIHCSATYEEHKKNVETYLVGRK